MEGGIKKVNQKKMYLFYFLKKIGIFIFSIFILSITVFYMSRLAPGDPLVSYYGDRAERMSTEEKEQCMERLGLNKPIYVQYGKWLSNAFKGDFGISFKYKQDVLKVIEGRIVNTLILGGIGFILIFALALLLGIICAYYEDTLIDKIICNVGNITSCIPEFWFSLILILFLCVNFKLLPSSGAYSIGNEHDIVDRIKHLILPLMVVIIGHLWYYAYIIRNKLLEEVRKDYVLLGKAKGLSKMKIMFNHCILNIMPAYIGLMAISIPHIIGGTYVIETVFSYPGIGTLSFESAKYHDYNMLMVICLITGVIVILSNIMAQIINERINPKMKIYTVIFHEVEDRI